MTGSLIDLTDWPSMPAPSSGADSHANLGPYEGGLDRGSARRALLATVRQHPSVTGEPRRIGTFQDIHGHPETGWPGREEGGPGARRRWLWIAGAVALGLLAARLSGPRDRALRAEARRWARYAGAPAGRTAASASAHGCRAGGARPVAVSTRGGSGA